MDLLVCGILIFCITASNLGHGVGQTFNVLNYGAVGDGQTDDSMAFDKAWQAVCSAGGNPTLQIPSQKSFLLQNIDFSGPCKSNGVHVEVLGNLVAPPTINEWKDCNVGRWLSFLYVDNLTVDGSGAFDGQGADWWKHFHKDKGGLDVPCTRPRAVGFHSCDNLVVSGLTYINSPGGHLNINGCHGVSLHNLNITAPGNSPNTDGIDIASCTRMEIRDSFIGTGDDCVAINGGTSYVNITNVACGPGHGISIGSLGHGGVNDTVEEIHVKNCSFTGTTNGARIKTWPGGLGFARKISYEQITLNAVRNPIIIDQFYGSGDRHASSAVAVSEVTYNGFVGTSADETAIRLNCSNVIPCTKIVLDNINITSAQPGQKVGSSCENAHGTSTSTTPKVPCLSGS